MTVAMLAIDLPGKHALVAGVADERGFGFAIAKALAEAGATGSVATWPPLLKLFKRWSRHLSHRRQATSW